MSPSRLASTNPRGEHMDRAVAQSESDTDLTVRRRAWRREALEALAILEEAIEAGAQAM
ncbi:hypothetical protein [Paraburkholderia unamae]|uniref:Uncharacterized protein n=1 Tax=Paraburkholderia unamae TaxID=219649 RepID=A0ACC6RMX1_9BURK